MTILLRSAFIHLLLPESPTNVAFGHGPHARALFITAGKSVYSIETRIPGFPPTPR